MSVKLRAGSMELEAAYIDWLRNEGYNPADGIDSFFEGSEFVRSQLPLIHESEKSSLIGEARSYLHRRSRDAAFAVQFPAVHAYADRNGRATRYTIAVTLSDTGAEWTGRAWDHDGTLGEVSGGESQAHANYAELARQHVESWIDHAGATGRVGARG